MRHVHRAAILAVLCLALAAGPAAAVVYNTTIQAIQQGTYLLGDTVLVDSVAVIGVDLRPNTFGVYIEELTRGAYSGTLAYTNSFPTYTGGGTPVVGDLVTVKGRYAEYSGLTEIDGPTLTKLGTVTPLEPHKLPVDSLKTEYPGSERWEGVLVRVDSVKVTSIGVTFREWYFHMNTGPAPGRVDSLAGYEKMVANQIAPVVGDEVSVIGVGDWVGGNARRIAPRNDADIIFLTPLPAPVPTLAYSSAENKIKVRFNVPLNSTDAQTPTKYSLSTFQTITAAVYDNPTKTVTLTVVSNMTPSTTPHVLSMSGIRNYQGLLMVGTQTQSFIGGIPTIEFVQTPKSSSNDSSQVVNQQVSIRGICTETTGGLTPDFPASLGGFYLQQRGSTQYGGLFVFGAPSTPVRGDSVFVSGLSTEFGVGPETEITSVDEVTVLASGRPAIVPPVVSLHDACGIDPVEGEKYESMLIKIANVTTLWQGGPGDPFDISTTLLGTDTLRVDDYAVDEAAYTPWRGDNLDVIGLIRYSGTLPFRRLQPRNWSEPPTGDIHVIAKANVSDATLPVGRTRLLQNQPNPFNPTTMIKYDLAREGHVKLQIFDTAGRHVKTLVDAKIGAGHQSAPWNGLDARGKRVASGLYFYQLVTDEYTATRKMVMLK